MMREKRFRPYPFPSTGIRNSYAPSGTGLRNSYALSGTGLRNSYALSGTSNGTPIRYWRSPVLAYGTRKLNSVEEIMVREKRLPPYPSPMHSPVLAYGIPMHSPVLAYGTPMHSPVLAYGTPMHSPVLTWATIQCHMHCSELI
eukprot:2227972-Rhodomonas_salina.1